MKSADRPAECYRCRQPITGRKVDGKWIAVNPDGSQHECKVELDSTERVAS